jgi:hypothetical protein
VVPAGEGDGTGRREDNPSGCCYLAPISLGARVKCTEAEVFGLAIVGVVLIVVALVLIAGERSDQDRRRNEREEAAAQRREASRRARTPGTPEYEAEQERRARLAAEREARIAGEPMPDGAIPQDEPSVEGDRRAGEETEITFRELGPGPNWLERRVADRARQGTRRMLREDRSRRIE